MTTLDEITTSSGGARHRIAQRQDPNPAPEAPVGCQKCVTGFDLAPLGCSFVLVDESAEDWPTFDAVADEVSLPLVARITGEVRA